MKTIQTYTIGIWLAWKEAFSDRRFALKFFLAPGLFFLYSALTQNLGNFVEARKGIRLEDPLLYWLPSHDYSVLVFAVLYGSLSLLVLTHLNQPRVIWRVIEMHFLVAIVRQVCILLVALEPPAGLIVLRDVFLENTVYPRHSPLTKDLFFSGHVASVYLYFLCARIKQIRWVLLGSIALMTFMILSMRVHYTYDVYGAFLFTFLIYKIPDWYRARRGVPALSTEVRIDS